MIKNSFDYAANVALESEVSIEDDTKISGLCYASGDNCNLKGISCLCAFAPVTTISVLFLFNCKIVYDIQFSMSLIHSSSVSIGLGLSGVSEMYSCVSSA